MSVSVIMPTRCSVEIEHNGNKARFYGELNNPGFAADVNSMIWLRRAEPIKSSAKEELILAALEYCQGNKGMTLIFFDGNGDLQLQTQYWERQGVCLKCGGELSRLRKKCRRCGGGGTVNYLLFNLWHIVMIISFLFSWGLASYFLEIFSWFFPVAVAFIAGYSAIVYIVRRIVAASGE